MPQSVASLLRGGEGLPLQGNFNDTLHSFLLFYPKWYLADRLLMVGRFFGLKADSVIQNYPSSFPPGIIYRSTTPGAPSVERHDSEKHHLKHRGVLEDACYLCVAPFSLAVKMQVKPTRASLTFADGCIAFAATWLSSACPWRPSTPL